MSLDQGGCPHNRTVDETREDVGGIDVDGRLRFLAWVSEEVSGSPDWTAALERVARAVVDELADLCAIEVVADGEPQQIAVAAADPAREALAAAVLSRGGAGRRSPQEGPRRAALRTGDVLFLTGITGDYWRTVTFDDEHAEQASALGIHSLIVVPLSARGRSTGVLTLAAASAERQFGPAHLVLARDLAARVALAIDNARLLADLDTERTAEQHARRDAERAAEQLARLQLITARLARVRTVSEVVDVVVDEGPAGVGAATASVSLLDESGERLDLVREGGYDPGVVAQFRRFRVDDPLPAADAIRTRQPVLLGSLAERDERYPAVRGAPTGNQSFAIIPLTVDDRVLGALAFSWSAERTFDDDEVRFMLAVADQCAQALDRSRLLDQERSQALRTAFLAEAGRVLAETLDAEQTLSMLVRLIVPQLADAAAVHIGDRRMLRLVAAANADSERERVTVDLGHASVASRSSVLHDVMRDGEVRLVEDVTPALLADIAIDDEHLAQLRAVDIRSVVLLPLVARDRVIGVLTMTLGPSGRRFAARDLPLMQDLASRAAAAIDNAWTHRTQREVAATLQRSLLPPELPAVPGLDVAARYHPVGDGSRVGGDFYDVFPAVGNRWAVVLGDVCGQGVDAAAFTAMVRWTTRLAATQQHRPSEVLRTVNETVLGADTGERFCTLVVAFVEPVPGGADVVLACGGHPLPLHRRAADGAVAKVGQPGTAIGLFRDQDVHLVDTALTLSPGDALVFFTDGVSEARSSAGAFRTDILERVLTISGGLSADQLVRAVDDEVLAFEGGEARDDIAVLAVRVPEG